MLSKHGLVRLHYKVTISKVSSRRFSLSYTIQVPPGAFPFPSLHELLKILRARTNFQICFQLLCIFLLPKVYAERVSKSSASPWASRPTLTKYLASGHKFAHTI